MVKFSSPCVFDGSIPRVQRAPAMHIQRGLLGIQVTFDVLKETEDKKTQKGMSFPFLLSHRLHSPFDLANLLLYCIVLYCIVLYCILFYSILFYSVLFSSILFCSVLFCSVLFSSVLFCSVLFYSILFNNYSLKSR